MTSCLIESAAQAAQPPVAYDEWVQTHETPVVITMDAIDPDGDGLTYEICDEPLFGTRSGVTSNSVTYTPWPGSLADSITFRAFDGALYSGTGTVSIAVEPGEPGPSVTLVSPGDGATVTQANGTFVCDALSETGLVDASLYVGLLETATFAGSGPVCDSQISSNNPGTNYGAALYNHFFPYSRYESRPWYGGHYGSGNENDYELFTAGGDDYIMLHLEMLPDSAVVSWASSILQAHSDRKAIVATHGFIDASGSRNLRGSDASYLWEYLVKPNANVFLVLCGHEHGEYCRTDVFAVSAMSVSESDAHVFFEGSAYRLYDLLYKDDLLDTNDWAPAASNAQGIGGLTEIDDPTLTGDRRF